MNKEQGLGYIFAIKLRALCFTQPKCEAKYFQVRNNFKTASLYLILSKLIITHHGLLLPFTLNCFKNKKVQSLKFDRSLVEKI